jgi:hypothetical protein
MEERRRLGNAALVAGLMPATSGLDRQRTDFTYCRTSSHPKPTGSAHLWTSSHFSILEGESGPESDKILLQQGFI